MSTASLNLARLQPLYPPLAAKAHAGIDQLKAESIPVLVTQGLRTFAEQDALYAQGRTTAGKVVTKAKGGRSWHNYGLAFDVVPLDANGKPIWAVSHAHWKRCAVVFKSLGLEWGGDWTSFKDAPHFQLIAGLQTTLALSIYKQGGLQAVWDQVSKRLTEKPTV